jgi:hypothetical protein
MTKRSKTFIRLDCSILGIHGLNSTDKIVLAYNRSFDHGSGYFASNRHAAATLCLNLKTFEKSVSKLKKLGLWKVRGQVVDVRQREGSAGTPPPGVETQPTGGESPPTREGSHPTRGVKESTNLPLKNDVLLDSSLDNVLDRDNKTQTASASEAADRPGSSSFEGRHFKIGSASFYNNNEAITEARLAGTTGSHMNRREMVDANWNAVCEGRCPPYSHEQLLEAPFEAVCGLLDEFDLMFGNK